MDAHMPWRSLEVPDSDADPARPDGGEPASHRAGEPRREERSEWPRLVMALLGALLLGASVGIVLLAQSRPVAAPEVAPAAPAARSSASHASASPSLLVVQVAGAVVHPGVYRLPEGSRVADALQAAGGYSPDVDPRQAEAQLNLAAKLQDSQLVHVPRRGEAAGSGAPAAGPTAGATINLNTASAEQLDTLPGVGPATAAKIIAARQEQPFASVDDLVTRKVLSASTLAKLRNLVTAP